MNMAVHGLTGVSNLVMKQTVSIMMLIIWKASVTMLWQIHRLM